MITFDALRAQCSGSSRMVDEYVVLSVLFPAISCLLATVTLDLSQYAMDVGKAIGSKTFMSARLNMFCVYVLTSNYSMTRG